MIATIVVTTVGIREETRRFMIGCNEILLSVEWVDADTIQRPARYQLLQEIEDRFLQRVLITQTNFGMESSIDRQNMRE